MGIIRITNIQVYAYHGCLIEEGKIGSDYRVDVTVKADLQPSAISDALEDTVDYMQIHSIVKEEMAIRAKLLEQVTKRMIERIFREIEIVKEATVTVSKINPPMEGQVEKVSVEMHLTR